MNDKKSTIPLPPHLSKNYQDLLAHKNDPKEAIDINRDVKPPMQHRPYYERRSRENKYYGSERGTLNYMTDVGPPVQQIPHNARRNHRDEYFPSENITFNERNTYGQASDSNLLDSHEEYSPASKKFRMDDEEQQGGYDSFHSNEWEQTRNESLTSDPVMLQKQEQILKLLNQLPRPVSTKEIIQNCGHHFKLPLQPLLYDMNDRGLIVKAYGYGPQAWKVNPHPPQTSQNSNPCGGQYESRSRDEFRPTFGSTESITFPVSSPISSTTFDQKNTRFDNPSPRPPSSRPPSSHKGPPLPPHKLVPCSYTGVHQEASCSSFIPRYNPYPQPAGMIPGWKPERTHSLPKPVLVPPPSKSLALSSKILSHETFNALNKNPVSSLNELAQKNGLEVTFEVLNEGRGHKNKFTVAAKIGDQLYDAVAASNMKDARRDAADAALRAILGKSAFKSKSGMGENVIDDILNPPSNGLSHFDNIATLSHHAFLLLSTMIQENFAGRKVIAGMIQQNGYEDSGRVVAMGTGNRCITGQRLSLEGKAVNDSHAEVVCRRAFLRYLYSQLESLYEGGESIFEKGGMNDHVKLKDGVTFHLYISTAPCGDGALFTPRQINSSGNLSKEHTPTYTSKPHGILRTKIEDGEGTIPIDSNDGEQTFDGILRGQRLRTMSCSDKICRWNVLGLQGALLSHLIEPIYLESLTLGYLYDHGHLSRAVCCRLDKNGSIDEDLPMPYFLNHPWIGRVTTYEASRETEKTNNISINWCCSDPRPEVTDGRTGACLTRTENAPTPSRLCKLELYKRFREVISKNERCAFLLKVDTYREAKEQASDYQTAKKCIIRKFRAQRFGIWVRKPAEQEMFSC